MTPTAPSTRCCAAWSASILLAIAVYAVIVPSLPTVFPSAALARIVRDADCRAGAGRGGRLSRAEPGVPGRHRHQPGRRRRCRGIPAPGRVPVRAGRSAARAQLPAARRRDRPALCAAAALRGLQLLASAARSRSRSIAPKARRERGRRLRRAALRAAASVVAAPGRAAMRGATLATLLRPPRGAGCRGRRAARLALGAVVAVAGAARGHVPARRLVGRLCARRCRSRCVEAASTASPIWASRAGFSGRLGDPAAGAGGDRLAGHAARSRAACWRPGAVRLGFVFTAIAVPGLFVDDRQAADRPGPAVRRGRRRLGLCAVRLAAGYASMPSGHATTAFAALVAIGAIFPQARALMWIYAVLIALSRVVVTAHHPSDVIAGAIVGAIGRAAGARLVCRPPARIYGRGRWCRCTRCRGRACGASSKRLPAACSLPRSARMSDRTATNAPAVSVIVPVRNEAGNIAPLVAEIAAALAGRGRSRSIYVNDGSTDGTEAELTRAEGAASLAAPGHAMRARAASRRRCAPAWRPRARRSSSRSTATARTIRRSCRS